MVSESLIVYWNSNDVLKQHSSLTIEKCRKINEMVREQMKTSKEFIDVRNPMLEKDSLHTIKISDAFKRLVT